MTSGQNPGLLKGKQESGPKDCFNRARVQSFSRSSIANLTSQDVLRQAACLRSQAAEPRAKMPGLQKGYKCPNKVDAAQSLDNRVRAEQPMEITRKQSAGMLLG